MVLVNIGHFFDQTMIAKTFENPRYLSGGLAERGAQSAVADAETLHAALGDGSEDRFVFGAEKVETAIAATGVLHRAADLVHPLNAVGRIVDCRKEVEVTPITGAHQLGKVGQAVDRFAHVGSFVAVGAITMFHPAVVFEKGNAVGKGLDSQHTAELIVHFDAAWTHVMSQAAAFLTGGQLRAEFTFVKPMETLAQKHGYVIGLDGIFEASSSLLVTIAPASP